jgi:hypothetical protein
MKKNDEKILKYLSNLMTDEETTAFKKELEISESLRKEFEIIKQKILQISSVKNPDINDLYFTNLIPKVQQKISSTKSLWKKTYFYYVVPTVSAAAIIFFLFFNTKNNFEAQYKELAIEIVSSISDNEVSEKYIKEIENEPVEAIINGSDVMEIKIPAEIKIDNENYIKLIGNPIMEEYSSMDHLSDSQLEKVYNKLSVSSSPEVAK